jgi:hypothetical protein
MDGAFEFSFAVELEVILNPPRRMKDIPGGWRTLSIYLS